MSSPERKSRFRRSRHENSSPTRESSTGVNRLEPGTLAPPRSSPSRHAVIVEQPAAQALQSENGNNRLINRPTSLAGGPAFNREEDPSASVSFLVNEKVEEDDDNDEDDEEGYDDEDGELIPSMPKSRKKQSSIPLPNQDVQSQLDKIQRIRLLQKIFPLSIFYNFFKYQLAGYNTESFMRKMSLQNAHPNLDLTQHTDGLTIGIKVKSLWSYKTPIVTLVKPFVRIHILDLETGLYMKSRDMPPVKPWNTTVRSKEDHNGSSADWQEEFIIPADLVDLASEKVLILLEIIDERPILSMRKQQRKKHDANVAAFVEYKKIAWAYLLPVGINGRLNIGHLSYHTKVVPAVSSNLSSFHREISHNSANNHNDDDELPPLITSAVDPSTSLHPLKSGKSVPDLQLQSLSSFHKDVGGNSSEPHSQQSQSQQPQSNKTVVEIKNIDYSIKLQLYAYRGYDGLIGWLQRMILAWPVLGSKYSSAIDDPAYPLHIPSIYLQYKLSHKHAIVGAFLEVTTGIRLKPQELDDDSALLDGEGDHEGLRLSPRSRMNHPDGFQHYHYYQSIRFHPWYIRKLKKPKSREERNRLRAAVLRRLRSVPYETCIVPNKFLCKLNVGPEGAMVVRFSYSGHLLAIASRLTTRNTTSFQSDEIIYSLRLYDTDYDEELWMEEIAHHGVIYDLQWSKNDRYLISCGGDGCCKIWDLLCFVPLMKQYPAQLYYQHHQNNDNHDLHSQAQHADDGSHAMFDSPSVAGGGMGGGGPHLSPRHLGKLHPPRVVHILTQPAGAYTYCGLFQEIGGSNGTQFPPTSVTASNASGFGMQQMRTPQQSSLPVTAVNQSIDPAYSWREQMLVMQNSRVPRVIIGGADGKIRVYDSGLLTGYILVRDQGDDGEAQDFSPHDGAVNALVIDERSRYLISADSVGDILAWKLDTNGWYQLLRKFKRDYTPMTTLFAQTKPSSSSSGMDSGSILSLTVHPNPLKGLMLVLSRQPATLKVLNMATYKPLSYCDGFVGLNAPTTSFMVREEDELYSAGVFYHANYSADGRYIICGSQQSSSSSGNGSSSRSGGVESEHVYRLSVWDTYTGLMLPSELSNLTFPYPIRTIAWHPAQHLLAVAMVGANAAVVLYCADRDSNNVNVNMNNNNNNNALNTANINNNNYSDRVTNSTTIPRTTLGNGIPRVLSALSSSMDGGGLGGGKEDFQYSIFEGTMHSTNQQPQNHSNNGSSLHPSMVPDAQNNSSLNYTATNPLTNSMNNNNRTLPLLQTKTSYANNLTFLPSAVTTPTAARGTAAAQSTSADLAAQLEEKEIKAAKARDLLAKIRASKSTNASINAPS